LVIAGFGDDMMGRGDGTISIEVCYEYSRTQRSQRCRMLRSE
jgi:hypothetical protein